MPSLSRRLSVVVLLALLAAALQAPRPALAANFVVNSLEDTDDGACTAAVGGCTLREAINAANDNAGPDTITFGVDGTISPAAPLPPLSRGGDTIDATSRARRLILSGQVMSTSDPRVPGHGMQITSGGNTVRGLVIVGFPFQIAATFGGAGIYLVGTAASGNFIYDNWIGVGGDGATAIPNQYAGVLIDDGASNNQIGGTAAGQGNLIAGNTSGNVVVRNLSTSTNVSAGNKIVGNRIGTNSAGTNVPNDSPTGELEGGVVIDRWARGTEIRNNLIGGHANNTVVAGIRITSDALDPASVPRVPRDTVIAGNRIGVNESGTAIPNRVGILLVGGARYGAVNTTIGDPDDLAGGRNYIAGNSFRGIEIQDSQVVTGDTLIVGNYIGLAPGGARVANGSAGATSGGEGIWIGLNGTDGSPRTTVGPGNVIAASRLTHLRIRSSNNIVVGNYIGTSPDGQSTSATSNTVAATVGYGSGAIAVLVENGTGNRIGGASAAERNVIASGGVALGGSAAPILIDPRAAGTNFCSGACAVSGTLLEGNYLGVRANGSQPLITDTGAVSGIEGVRIRNSTGNTLRANLIGGLGRGLLLDTGANNNVIEANLIGTNASGNLAGGGVPNNQDGIRLVNGTGNRFENNIIAFNARVNNNLPAELGLHGIRVGTANSTAGGTDNNQFIGNRLVDNGTSANGAGIFVQNSQRILISRTTTESHGEAGIVLVNSNNGIQPPALTQPGTTAPTISGSAPGCGQGCVVELFTGPSTTPAAERDEGPVYLAQATTGAGGSFTLSLAGCLNWATATVRDANGNTSAFSAPVDLTGNTTCQLPTITLSAASPNTRSVEVGTSTTYVHTVSHDSPIARTYNVVVSSSRGWASAPTTITLQPDGSAELSVEVSVPAGTPNGTTDVTTVRVTLAGTSAQSAQQTDTTTAEAITQSPASPAVSPGITRPLTPGQTTFTHTVTNTGDLLGTFELVGPTFVGAAPAGWSIASATLADTTLEGGQSTTLTIVVNNPEPLPAAGNVSFSFRVRVVGGAQTDPATVDTIVVPQRRSFTFTGPDPAAATTPVGGAATYVYTLANTGNASDSFQVTIPSGTTPPAAGITFDIEPAASFQLDAGASRTITVTASVASGVPAGSYAFSARAQATGGTNPPAAITRTGTIVVTGGGVPLFVGVPSVAPAEAEFEAATEVTITWGVRNNGNTPAPISFALEGALPNGITQVGPITDTCADPLPNTNAGSSCSVTLVVSVAAGLPAGPRTVAIRATADNSAAGSPNASAVGTAEVVVETVRGVAISAGAPATPPAVLGAPGEVITFTHTLRNTGNAPDSFALSAESDLGWTTVVSPTQTDDLGFVGPNDTLQVTVQVSVPTGVISGTLSTVTVTARSDGDDAVSDNAENLVEVEGVDGADLSPGQTQSSPPGTTVTYTHTLTNTGSTPLAYRLEATNSQAGWPEPVVEPAGPLGPLAPGETVTLTVRLDIPAAAEGGTTNETTLRVFAEGAPPGAPALDTEVDVLRVGAPFDVLIRPDRSGTAPPDSKVVLTHTVTNVGTNRDSYRLSVVEAGDIPAFVGPDFLDLGPGESQTISVTLILPAGLRAGSTVFARVRATSLSQPSVTGSATDEITIAPEAAVDLSSTQERGVLSGGEVNLRSLTLHNIGNAVDTFTLSFEDVSGIPGGVTLQFNPGSITLDANEQLRGIALRATVPSVIPAGERRRVRVVARSTTNPSVSDSVTVDIVYLPDEETPNPTTTRLYLPLLGR